MGQLSGAWLAELQKNNPTVIPFVTIAFPSGSKRYASGSLSRTGVGNYDGKVMSWGSSIERSISDRDGNLATPMTSAFIDDTDNTLLSLLEGGDARGSDVTIRLSSPNVAPFTVFKGTLTAWRMASLTTWELIFQYRDGPLRGKAPRNAFLSSDWPNADTTIYGQFAPIVYGLHDSTGSTSTGMVPCFLVDKSIVATTPAYVVAHGWLQSVDRVFAGGILKTLTTHYTIQHPVVNGRQWTTINFVAGQGPAATVAVTADVHGYETVGNGTGAMIQGSDQIRHLLENFYWGDYQTGLWLTPSFTLDAAFTTTKTYFTQMGYLNSRWYGGSDQVMGFDALAEFLRTNQVFAYWTNTGMLAILPNDPRDLTTYYDSPSWIAENRGEIFGDTFRVDFNRDSLVDRINAQFLLSSAGAGFQKQLEVRNSSVSENISETLEMPWSQSA